MALLFVIIAISVLTKPIVHVHSSSIPFSYSGSTGPDRWASLSPDYALCSMGRSQSPINIVNFFTKINPNLKALDIQFYAPVDADLVNYGYGVEIDYKAEAGVLNFGGKNYSLQGIHWHTPSEHKIEGFQFASEVHLFHRASDNSEAVVSIFLQLGKPDPIITKVQQQLSELPMRSSNQTTPKIALGNINITKELIELTKTNKYYNYNGSLTTPPCREGVTWIILAKIGTISNDQVEALKRPLDVGSKNNARPVQALNGRKVEVYYKSLIN